MSSTIDERVVELRFDNKQFESGVRESLATLEKLKEATNKSVSSKSFEGLQKAANGLDLSNISKGIESLQGRFSTLGIAGMRVISNITDGLMNGLGGAIHSVTSSIVSGGIKRAMNIENAHFQLQGLIKDEKEVQAVMQQANDSVDGTAYSYDVAAKAASMFAASGLKSGQQMENALKGIAGVAATANADYERISELFTTIAGKGKIQAIELNRFASMGMNAAAALTNYLNDVNSGAIEASESVTEAIKGITDGVQITEEELRDLVHDGLISFDIFSEAMSTTFGEHAKDANQTFTGAMSNIRAALARTGAMFITPLIKQNGPFVQLFNAIRIKVNEFNKALGAANGIAARFTNWVNNMVSGLVPLVENFKIANIYTRKFADGTEKVFESAHKGVQKWGNGTEQIIDKDIYTPFHAFSDIIQIVVYSLQGLKSILVPIGEAFADAFSFDVNNLYKGIESLKQMASHFKLSQESADNLYDAFRGVFDIIRTGISLVVRLVSSFLPFQDQVADTGASFLEIIGYIGRGLSEFSRWVNESKTLNEIFDAIRSTMSWVYDGLSKGVGFISEFLHSLDFSVLGDIFTSIADMISPIDALKTVFGGLRDFIISAGDAIAERFGGKSSVMANVQKVIEKLAEVFGKLKDAIVNSIKEYGPLEAFFKTLNGALLTGILVKLRDMVKIMKMDPSKGKGIFGSIKQTIAEIGASLKRTTAGLAKMFKSLSHLIDAKAVKELAIAIAILAGSLWFLSTLSYSQITKGLGAISAMMYEVMGAMTLLEKGLSGSDDLKDALTGVLDAVKINMLASSLLKIGVAILLLSVAVKSLGSVNFIDLAKGLGAVTILLGEMMGVMLIISKMGVEKLTSVGLGMILIAGAVRILAGGVMALGKIDTKEVIQGLISIGALLLELGIFTAMTGGAEKMISVGIGMLLVAGAIKMLGGVIKTLGDLNINQIAQGLAAIAGIILSLGIYTMLAGGAKKMILASAAMVILSYAIKGIAESLMSLSMMSWGQIARSLVVMGVALAELTGVLLVLGQIKAWKLAKGIIALSSIIEIIKSPMSEMLMNLAKLSWDQIARSLTAMTGALLIVLGTMFLLRKFKIKDLLKATISLGSVSKSMYVIAQGLVQLASIGWKGVAVGLTALGGAIAELLATMLLISKMKLSNVLFGVILLALAIRAIQPIVPIMQELGSIGWSGVLSGLVAFGGALGILIGAMYLAGVKAQSGAPLVGALLIALLLHTIQPIIPIMQGLGSIGWDGVLSGLAAFAGAMGILIGAMYLAGAGVAAGGVGAAIPLVGALLLALIINTIQPIVPMMQGLGNIGWEGVKTACLGLAGCLAILIVAMFLAGAVAPYTAAGSAALTSIANVLPNIASSMQVLSSISWAGMKEACKGLAITILTLLVSLIVIGALSPMAIAGAAALGVIITELTAALSFNAGSITNIITKVSDAMTKFMEIVDTLAKADKANIDKATACLTGLISGLGEALKSFGLTSGIRAIGFDEVTDGISKLTDVIKVLNEVDAAKVGDALTNIGTSMESFGKSLKSFQLLSGIRAIGFTKMCDGLAKLAQVFATLNTVNPVTVGKGLIWAAKGMAQMGIALKSYDPMMAEAQARAMFIVAQAIEKIAPAVKTLSTVPLGQVTTIMESLGTAFKDFGTALDNTPFWGSGMRASGINALCEGISTLTEALPELITIAGGEGGRYVKQALNIVGGAFKDFGDALSGDNFWFAEDRAAGIVNLCEGIKALNAALPELIKVTAGEGGRYVSQGLGIVGKAFYNFGSALKNTPIFNADERGAGIVEIVNSITTLSDGMKTFINDIGTGEEVKTAFEIVTSAFWHLGSGLRNTPLFNADERGQGLATVAANVKSLASGIKDFVEIVNENDAKTLQQVLTYISTAFMDFGVALKTAGFINPQGKADAIVSVVNSVDKLVDAVVKLTGLKTDVEGIQTVLDAIGTAFKDFGMAIKKAGFWDAEGRANAVVTVVNSIDTLISSVQRVSNMPITDLQQLLGSFAGGIMAIGKSLKEFDEMAVSNANVIAQVVDSISVLTTYTKDQYAGAIEGINGLIGILTNIGKFDTASLTQFNTALKKTATEGLQKFVEEFTNQGPLAVEAVRAFLDAIILAMDEYTSKFQDMGKKHGEAYVAGLRSVYDQAATAGKMLGMKAYSGLELQVKNFEEIGVMCAKGFARGLVNSEALAAIAKSAAAIGAKAKEATKASVDSQSPSKDFMKIGAFCGEGMAIGLYEWGDKVATAAGSLGESAKSGLQLALENLNKEADDILSGAPVITPMVDLTNVMSAAGQINSMFNSALYRTNSGTRSIASVMSGRVSQNGSEEFQNENGSRFGTHYTFVQNNNSPKALSRLDIYRDTKSLFKQYREAVEGV